MKRCLSVLLCVAMLLCLLPAFPAAAEDPKAISDVRLTLPGELFDGSGKLLPTGKVTDLNPVSKTDAVLAEAVRWFRGGIPMKNPDSEMQPFTSYRVYVRLQAEGDGIFTADTQVEILETIQPVRGISTDGKTAYVLSPGIMTACDHSAAELQADISGHWLECPRCFRSFELSDHLWDEGTEEKEEILYSCTVCGTEKTEAAGKKLLYKADLDAAPAVLRESIPEPAIKNDDEFRIVRYQWFKGGTRDEHQVAVGDSFEEDSYYLSITVRVKNPGRDYISLDSYIGTSGTFDEISRTVDADAGAITSVFSIPVYPATTANITLPTIIAGESIAHALNACNVSSPEFTPDLTSVLVYENGAFLGLYAKTGLGFSTWTGEDAAFQPGNSYTLIGTASFADWYTDAVSIRVENPEVCADLDAQGSAESLGFRATYLCADEPAITSVAVSGIRNPVAATKPAQGKLNCEDAALYEATLTTWYDDGEEVTTFEEGRTYQAIVAVTPKKDADGLDQDTAPLLPVSINGQLAEFVSIGENGAFLYSADFLCEPTPHTHAYEAAVTDPTCTEGGYTTHTCTCGDSYQDSETAALGHAWDEGRITISPTEQQKGEMTYTCTRCDKTKTETLPELEHKHSYQPTVTEATCIAGGYTTHLCDCGHSYRNGETAALGHDYQNGLCNRCGTEDPNAPCTGGENCPGSSFSDLPAPTNWAHKGIDYCVENKLMNGTGDGKFNPGGTLTRAELVTILYRVENSPEAAYKGTFADVKEGQWYTAAIEWAAENGIVNGVGDGTSFDPSGIINREQIATILYRYEVYKNCETAAQGDLNEFPDASDVSAFAATAMIWANQEGIINGITVNNVTKLAPKASATREQIASIMMRYLTAE